MELMPHLKSLVDDITKMTSKIIIKRPNKRYENEDGDSIELYNAYKEIVLGTDSFKSYGTIPPQVLEKITKWNKISNEYNFVLPYNTERVYSCIECDSTDEGALLVVSDGSVTIPGETINISNVDIDVPLGSCVQILSPRATYYSYSAPTVAEQLDGGSKWIQKLDGGYFSEIQELNTVTELVSYSFKIGNEQHSSYRDIDCYDSNGRLCHPYFTETYGTEVRKDDYGKNFVKVSNSKFSYNDFTSGYVKDDDGEYYHYISYGFVYDDYIVDGDPIYVDVDEYLSNEWKYSYLSGPYFLKNDEYILITNENDDSEIDESFYKVNIVTKRTDSAYSDEELCSFDNIVTTSESKSYKYYFSPNSSGNYYLNDGEYEKISETDTVADRYEMKDADGLPKYSIDENNYVRTYDGDYVYLCKNYITYINNSIKVDKEITSLSKLDREYWDAAVYRMREYVVNQYCPPLNKLEYSTMMYPGEKNPYYRTLNGLPKDSTEFSTAPRIDRLSINPNYHGTNLNPYVYELTDNEINIISNNGTLNKIKELNKSAEYLNYLGKNRIDVIKARDADDFDILYITDIENSYSMDLFKKCYYKSKEYILNRNYNPELFGDYNKYLDYISYLILSYTVCDMLSKSTSIIVDDKYTDDETINNILGSYGYDTEFSALPAAYRKEISTNIITLLKNRGTNKIYDIIANICNASNLNIYRYILNGDGTIEKESITTGSRESTDLTIDDLTESDIYWKTNDITQLEFGAVNLKYIDIDASFDLLSTTINNSYLLNYLLDTSKNRDTKLEIESVGEFSIFNCIVALFACQAIKCGISGFIPSSVSNTESILKFNLDSIVNNNANIRNILNKYRSKLPGDRYINLENLLQVLNAKGSIIIPENTDSTVRAYISAYVKTTQKDIPGTTINENSFYEEIKHLRDTTTNYNEYMCCNELLECIGTAKVTSHNFELDHGVWEPIFAGHYIGSLSSYSKTNYSGYIWSYGNDLSASYSNLINVSLTNGDTEGEYTEYLTDLINLYYGHSDPNTLDSINTLYTNFYLRVIPDDSNGYYVTLYQYCQVALTYDMYLREECRDIYDMIYKIDTGNIDYVINAHDSILNKYGLNGKVYLDNSDELTIDCEDNVSLANVTQNGNFDEIIINGDMYSIDEDDYFNMVYNNANKIYNSIINKFEFILKNENGVINHISLDSISTAIDSIKTLISVFKSFNSDILNTDIEYKANDKLIRIFDSYSFNMNLYNNDSISISDEAEIIIDE